MTSKQVALVQDSFAKVALTSEAAAVLFYDRLFDIAPQMKAMFPDANEKLAPAQLAATKYLMCVNRAKFVGKALPVQWDDTVRIFSQVGILPAEVKATTYYTYDYLPPESELRPCPLK